MNAHKALPPSYDPEEELANAIIIRAVEDYKKALRTLKRDPGHRMASRDKRSIEKFFSSGWCKLLTQVDMQMIAAKLRREILCS